MRKLALIFLVIAALGACRNKQNLSDASRTNWVNVKVRTDTLRVHIPIEGKLTAWKKVDLLSPMRVKLIALLVEKGEPVRQGDLLMSLWPVGQGSGYSPISLYSPLKGTVAAIYFHLNDTVPPQKVLMTIENRENLILKSTVGPGALFFIQRNQNVILHFGEQKIKGAVLDVDKKSSQITVVVPNGRNRLKRDVYVYGYVDVGEVAGSFLPIRVFAGADSLSARTGSQEKLTLFKAGQVGDSLAIFYPQLPNIRQLQVKKNLDISK